MTIRTLGSESLRTAHGFFQRPELYLTSYYFYSYPVSLYSVFPYVIPLKFGDSTDMIITVNAGLQLDKGDGSNHSSLGCLLPFNCKHWLKLQMPYVIVNNII